jgi:hypothetical protein
MEDALGRGRYVEPRVADYGDLVALTSAMQLLYGSATDPSVRDMSFSGAGGGGGGGTTASGASSPVTAAGATPATQTPAGVQNVTTTAGGGQAPAGTTPTGGGGGGGAPASGGGGGVGPGGDGLPFTGYPAATVAAVGTGIVAAGAALRRAVRPQRGR